MNRLMWWKPWDINRFWLPRYFFGADEDCNKSVVFVIPPVGAVIIFYKRQLRPKGSGMCQECMDEFGFTEQPY